MLAECVKLNDRNSPHLIKWWETKIYLRLYLMKLKQMTAEKIAEKMTNGNNDTYGYSMQMQD